ncbi:MAG TPA: Tim44-like domain-containing protein [Burkholderiales bacterium]|nr:Tim44-like domain-containing protein [Burkholderiales bacterium]
MKKLLSFAIALFSLVLMIEDSEARRMSGSRNLGMQRSAPAQQQAAPKAPAQQQQQQAAPATPAQQPAGASKWLGPLAGLALGAGLAALFLNNGWAGLLSGMLLIGLMVAALVFLARVLLRGKVAREPLQYAGASASGPSLSALPGGAGAHSVAATAGRWPADFDAGEFVRHARLNFVRLQEAHDRKDLTTMRDFLAPAVYQEVEADIRAAGEAPQATEVLTLEAEVLDVVEEAGSYIVSVRFSGLIRESAGGEAEAFGETWHLEKPVKGRAGWLVAGIQQE